MSEAAQVAGGLMVGSRMGLCSQSKYHLARISTAAVYFDARHIDEGTTFLKQRAQPHA